MYPQESLWHFPAHTILTLDCMSTLGPKQCHCRDTITCGYWRITTCTLYIKHFSLFKIIFILLPLNHHLRQTISFYRGQNRPDRCCLLASHQWRGGAGRDLEGPTAQRSAHQTQSHLNTGRITRGNPASSFWLPSLPDSPDPKISLEIRKPKCPLFSILTKRRQQAW